ncbi:hypothetical protein ASPTUDRAFT_35446 [Aspergillus tubingensis CBS 134.48]|uniref:Uncharacterized protein n=1 Tax=Aspergillus tubingensis (strain CBS 134.48) TaxID=767770 RepID=A0A1L9NH13_ASPTC|nr:hypothetical protein ASPTUDRAFT_35446 [Aspergillus tubingensis CBS 134.48]
MVRRNLSYKVRQLLTTGKFDPYSIFGVATDSALWRGWNSLLDLPEQLLGEVGKIALPPEILHTIIYTLNNNSPVLAYKTKYPWEEPHKVLWTLGNGTDRLISISPFQNHSMCGGISGLRFTYESGRTINADTTTTRDPTLPGVTLEKEDRLCKVVIRKCNEDFDIYFSFKNARTGQVTTRSLDNYKNFGILVYDAEISRYVIDIDQRHYKFDDGWQALQSLPSQILDDEVVGLCVSDIGTV